MSANEFIQARMRALGPHLLPAVRPLAVPNDSEDELVPAGTAVLLWHRGHQYMFSAAHVIEEYTDRACYIGTQSSWIEILGPWKVNSPPHGVRREDDTLDLAYRRVDAAFADRLDGCRFLTGNEQAVNEEIEYRPPHRSKYLVIGYPLNRFEMKRYSRTTIPGNIAYAGSIASPEQHAAVKLSPHLNAVVEYQWDEVVGPSGPQRSPKLQGISGGAMFRFPALEQVGSLALPQLAAINIEERRRERLLIGTRIGAFFHGISKDGELSA